MYVMFHFFLQCLYGFALGLVSRIALLHSYCLSAHSVAVLSGTLSSNRAQTSIGIGGVIKRLLRGNVRFELSFLLFETRLSPPPVVHFVLYSAGTILLSERWVAKLFPSCSPRIAIAASRARMIDAPLFHPARSDSSLDQHTLLLS